MVVAAVDGRGSDAALEVQKERVAPLSGTRAVFRAKRRTDTAHKAPADPTQDIDLVRSLAEERASALCPVEFGREPRAVEPVRVRPGVEHAKLAKLAATDEGPHRPDRRLQALRMSDDELAPGGRRRIDHRRRVVERNGHRLFDDNVLARRQREEGVPRVEMGGGRYVDDVYVHGQTETVDVVVPPGGEVSRERRDNLGTRIGHGGDYGPGVAADGGDQRRPGLAKARDTDPQDSFAVRHAPPPSPASRA